MTIPQEIRSVTDGLPCRVDGTGCSGDTVLLFGNEYILKISEDSGRLLREKERVDWLDGKMPCAKSVRYLEEDGKCFYLRTQVKGESLISPRFLNDPGLLTDVLAEAAAALRTLDGLPCPFRSGDNEGADFVHGDCCLPNIFADADGHFAGFIDLDNCGLGDRWYDYSWMLWSLRYNLKTGRYDDELMRKLGIGPCPAKYDEYIPEEMRNADE